MTKHHLLAAIVLAIAVAACSGHASFRAGASSGSTGAEQGSGRIVELDALHDELAPVFHADHDRAAMACAHANVIRERSAAVHAVATPAGVDAAAWTTATSRLDRRAEGLRAECAASGPGVERRLASLHHAFHIVVALVPAQHDDDDDGDDHGHGDPQPDHGHDDDHGHDGDHHDEGAGHDHADPQPDHGHDDDHGHDADHHDDDHGHDADHHDGDHHDEGHGDAAAPAHTDPQPAHGTDAEHGHDEGHAPAPAPGHDAEHGHDDAAPAHGARGGRSTADAGTPHH